MDEDKLNGCPPKIYYVLLAQSILVLIGMGFVTGYVLYNFTLYHQILVFMIKISPWYGLMWLIDLFLFLLVLLLYGHVCRIIAEGLTKK